MGIVDNASIPPQASGSLFAHCLRQHGQRTALVSDEGVRLSYAKLADLVDLQAAQLGAQPRLTIVEADNTVACVVAYLACLQAGHPVILSEPGSTSADSRTADLYGVETVFRNGADGARFEALTSASAPAYHPELCILLSTSGTTGSPKLVRLSRTNIQSSAAGIASYLGITPDDVAITSLPLFYSYGMSVLNSHLHAGATVLLTKKSVADAEFWTFFRTEGATSLHGVPFTFDILERMGFRSHQYPRLRFLAQAGGRLPVERVHLYAEWARATGRQMFVMYGQTEASPRMAYVPPDLLLDNLNAIGIPVPGGSFDLIDEDGKSIADQDVPGEMVYRGPNVMMGYAESQEDLAKGPELTELRTGDLACRKDNGCYYIVGRKSRFSKIVGLRVSLDEIERWLGTIGVQGVVSGDDKLIVVAVTSGAAASKLKERLLQRYAVPASAFLVLPLAQIPTLSSGKFDYRTVLRLGHEAANADLFVPASLLEGYRDVLGNADVRPGDSFLDLGGDSISLVEISLMIEAYLGAVPDNWEAQSIATLEAMKGTLGDSDEAGLPVAARQRSGKGTLLQACLVAFAVLFAGEVVLQTRSYLKTGRSAFSLVTGESRVMLNERFGVLTYRPNLKDDNLKDDLSFTTNTLGFRSPAIAPAALPGELRIAVVGASTVAGAYAKTNDDTFPHLLETRLRKAMPDRPVNVINAGVEGYTVRDIERLVERAIVPLRPNVVVIYPGFNDMVSICKAGKDKPARPLQPLPALKLPSWVLSREMISKNTLPLRRTPDPVVRPDLEQQFPAYYQESLENMVGKLQAAGITPVLLTVARAFKPGDGEMGRRMATTALFYNYCLDYDGLNQAGSMFNQVITDVGRARGVRVVDLGQVMPSGPKLFVDAAHFTRAGEEYSAELIFNELVNDPAVVSPSSLTASH